MRQELALALGAPAVRWGRGFWRALGAASGVALLIVGASTTVIGSVLVLVP